MLVGPEILRKESESESINLPSVPEAKDEFESRNLTTPEGKTYTLRTNNTDKSIGKRKFVSAKAFWLKKVDKDLRDDGAICAKGALGRKSTLKKPRLPKFEEPPLSDSSTNNTENQSNLSETSKKFKSTEKKNNGIVIYEYKQTPKTTKETNNDKDTCERMGQKLINERAIFDRYADSETGSDHTANLGENFKCNPDTNFLSTKFIEPESSTSSLLSKKINLKRFISEDTRTNITFPSRGTSEISVDGSSRDLENGGLSIEYTAGEIIEPNSSARCNFSNNTTQPHFCEQSENDVRMILTMDSMYDTSCDFLSEKSSGSICHSSSLSNKLGKSISTNSTLEFSENEFYLRDMDTLFNSQNSNTDDSSHGPVFRCYETTSTHELLEKSTSENLSTTSDNTPYDNMFA